MTPHIPTKPMNTEQLQSNIARLETLQRQLGLKDAPFCRRYLGGISEKTWTHRLKARKLDEISDRMAERIGVISRGRLIAEGSLEELRHRTGGAGGRSLEDVFLALVAEPDASAAGQS